MSIMQSQEASQILTLRANSFNLYTKVLQAIFNAIWLSTKMNQFLGVMKIVSWIN
jgi:hypothetical protein